MSAAKRAAEVLREYAEMIADSETVRAIGHPMQGKIDDPKIQAEVDEYRALADQLDADRWIPIAERLPDDELTVMIAPLESDEDVWFGFHDADGWHFADAMPAHVSHWKPMPEGPKP